jgi:hypothetical protein
MDRRQAWEAQGFWLEKALISPAEVEEIRIHFMAWNDERRSAVADGIDPTSSDPLARFPRVMHPHRVDDLSKRFLLDGRIRDVLVDLLGEEPLAAQTMVYFKPPRARGQALHQDQAYLRVSPGTCVAAWIALDPCDEENGCMEVVPGSHKLPLLCPVEADLSKSFVNTTLELPPGYEAVPAIMEPGDVLFFHGNLIHGSGPNESLTRFRRAHIAHYITAEAREVWTGYKPILRFNGEGVDLDDAEAGGTCGKVTESGIEMVAGHLTAPNSLH